MTPAEQLAAARERVVGPYLPAKAEWTDPWTGPCEASSVHDWKEGVVLRGGRLLMTYGGRSVDVGFDRCQVRLDVRRPEVRDHLVRLGCPAWARDVPAAVWCWGMDISVASDEPPWENHVTSWRRAALTTPRAHVSCSVYGWVVGSVRGPETGDLGRACADVAALNAGCILREPGGWLVPLRGGGIGFFPEVSRDE